MILVTLVVLVILTGIFLTLKTKAKPKLSLEPFISTLTKYAATLVDNILCKPVEYDKIASDTNDIIIKADSMIETNKDNFDPIQIKAYDDIKKKVSDLLTNAKDKPVCKIDKCVQGTYHPESNNCICEDEKYPVPIIVNKKVYCYSDNCSNYPNSTFQPNESSDSSLNKCVCADGYTKDANTPFCYNKQASETLETYIKDLTNTTIPSGISDAVGKYKDFQIVEGSMDISNTQPGNARTLVQCIELAKSAGKKQVVFDGVHCYYGDYSGKETITPKEKCQAALQF